MTDDRPEYLAFLEALRRALPERRGLSARTQDSCGRSPKHGQRRQLCSSLLHKSPGANPQVDGPSIGLLLCRSKNRLVAEYALRDIHGEK